MYPRGRRILPLPNSSPAGGVCHPAPLGFLWLRQRCSHGCCPNALCVPFVMGRCLEPLGLEMRAVPPPCCSMGAPSTAFSLYRGWEVLEMPPQPCCARGLMSTTVNPRSVLGASGDGG